MRTEKKSKIEQRSRPKPKSPPDQTSDQQPEGQGPREVGGRSDGLDPTRYGDWEKNGRCIDF